MKISEVLAQYETDKINDHHYGDAYNKLFAQFERNAPLNILEIGTQKGGSLLAWKEYFPNARVTGIDIIDALKTEYYDPKIRYIISDIKKWDTDEMYDIIIDDGSHLYPDVQHVVHNFIRTGKNYDDVLMVIYG